MGKIKMEAKIIRQDEIATDIYSMVIQAPEIASQAVPGQFIDVYSADGSKLLPRPISLCEIDRAAGTLRIVYRIAGKGTKEFSMLTSDHTITILGPLGNGFTKKDKKAILIGGGIGIPPMLQLAKELTCEKSIVLGFRDEEFLSEEFDMEPYTNPATTAQSVSKERLWMQFASTASRAQRFMPADQHRCFVRFRAMHWNMASKHSYP